METIFLPLTDAGVQSLAERIIKSFGKESALETSKRIVLKYTDDTENQINLRDTYTRVIKYIESL
jgi:hypothetical protein